MDSPAGPHTPTTTSPQVPLLSCANADGDLINNSRDSNRFFLFRDLLPLVSDSRTRFSFTQSTLHYNTIPHPCSTILPARILFISKTYYPSFVDPRCHALANLKPFVSPLFVYDPTFCTVLVYQSCFRVDSASSVYYYYLTPPHQCPCLHVPTLEFPPSQFAIRSRLIVCLSKHGSRHTQLPTCHITSHVTSRFE